MEIIALAAIICILSPVLMIYWIRWTIEQYKNKTLLNTRLKKFTFLPAFLHGFAFCLFWELNGYALVFGILTWSTPPLWNLLAFLGQYFWWYWGALSLVIWCLFMKIDHLLSPIKDIIKPPRLNGTKSFFLFGLKVVSAIIIFVLIISLILFIVSFLGDWLSEIFFYLYAKLH